MTTNGRNMFTGLLWRKMAGSVKEVVLEFLQYIRKRFYNRGKIYENTHYSSWIWVVIIWVSAILISVHFFIFAEVSLGKESHSY